MRRSKRPGRSIFAGLIAIISLTGCGTASTSAPASAQPSVIASSSAAASATDGAVSLPIPEQASIRLGTGSISSQTFVSQLAQDLGLYEKYGLDVEILFFESATQGVQALAAGQVHVLRETPQAAFLTAGTEQALVSVATFYDRFLDCLYTSPTITTADQLQGQRVAVSSLGGQSHQVVLLGLNELGLEEADVNVVQVGGEGDRIAALQAGSVQMIPAECQKEEALTAEGFNIILRMADLDLRSAQGGLLVSKAFAQENPNTVLAVVAAHLEAIQFMFDQPDEASKLFVDWAAVDEATAQAGLDGFRTIALRDLRWTKESFENFKSFMVLQEPQVEEVNVEDAYSFEFLDKLEELGLNRELGVPD